MGDAEHRTALPLLSAYKYGLAARRLLETATGGVKLRRSPCYLNLLQLSAYLAPLALAVPFLVLDALGVWREHTLALVYTIIHTLAVFTLRLCVYFSIRCLPASTQIEEHRTTDSDDDSSVEITSFHGALSFMFSLKAHHPSTSPLSPGLPSPLPRLVLHPPPSCSDRPPPPGRSGGGVCGGLAGHL